MVNISQHTFRLYKREKLCSDTAIDLLFSRQGGGQAALFFPCALYGATIRHAAVEHSL